MTWPLLPGRAEVKVSPASPFEFELDAKKGAATCSGRVTRLPFSRSKSSFCHSVDASGKATGEVGSSGD